MRNILFLLMLTFLFAHCSDDDNCTLSDWQGSYIGTKDCNGDIQTNFAFEIIANNVFGTTGQNNLISIDDQTFVFESCTIVGGTVVSPTIANTFEGGLMDNELDFTVRYGTGGFCTWTATKQ